MTDRRVEVISLMELCKRTIAHVEAEPRRLYMDYFVTLEQHPEFQLLNPPCRTVCCTAGWLTLMAGKDITGAVETTSLEILVPTFSVFTTKASSTGEAIDRMERCRSRLRDCFYTFPLDADPGTPEYVERALAPFKEWMTDYKDYLQDMQICVPVLPSEDEVNS